MADQLTREAVLEREKRLAGPTAIAGYISALLLIAGVIVHLKVPQKSNASDQLLQFSAHHQALLASGVLVAAGLLFAIAPLTYLFRAAAARNPRVRPTLIAFCIIGPLLFGVQTIVASQALKTAGDSFTARKGSEQTQNVKVLQNAISSDPSSLSKVTLYNTDGKQNAGEVEKTDGTFYSVTFPAKSEVALKNSLDKASVDTSEDSSGKIGDAYANHLALDSNGYKLAGNLALPAGVMMIFGVVYPALQAFRVGLITRLLSTLGALAAASLILLPLAPAFIGMWLAWLCLIYLDRVPKGRSRAWDAGMAVPWPRPGQQPTPEAPIEGTAQELDPDAPAPNPPRQRGERRKRKSRG